MEDEYRYAYANTVAGDTDTCLECGTACRAVLCDACEARIEAEEKSGEEICMVCGEPSCGWCD